MAVRGKGSYVFAVVVTLCGLVGGGRDAHAGGIVAVMAVSTPVGDPTFVYTFEVDLLPQSTLSPSGFITVYDIPFLGTTILTSQPNTLWGASVQNLGMTPPDAPPLLIPDDPAVPNVTWQYNGPAIANDSATSNLDLGNFQIGLTVELASAPTPTLLFVGSLGEGVFSNLGFVTVVGVPEPSSVALLLTGIAALPLFWHRHKTRSRRLKVTNPV
jgi:hypothetical protein